MKQELQTVRASGLGRDGDFPKHNFAVLFALARKPQTSEQLRACHGMSDPELGRVLDRLHREYMVDVVSALDGRHVIQSLKLTEEGELALMGALEKMCELPES